MVIYKPGAVVLLLAGLLNGCTALVVGGAAAGAGGYYAAKDERTLAEISDDAEITFAINTKFVQDEMVSAIAINVDTHRGVVTLAGTVDNPTVARRAYDLAYSVEGVSQVISKLTVRSSPMTPWGPVSR